MSKRLFLDFLCERGHKHEAYTDSETQSKPCPVCGQTANRIISAPNVRLEGITGAFPGAAMQWERKRAEKIAVERKQSGA